MPGQLLVTGGALKALLGHFVSAVESHGAELVELTSTVGDLVEPYVDVALTAALKAVDELNAHYQQAIIKLLGNPRTNGLALVLDTTITTAAVAVQQAIAFAEFLFHAVTPALGIASFLAGQTLAGSSANVRVFACIASFIFVAGVLYPMAKQAVHATAFLLRFVLAVCRTLLWPFRLFFTMAGYILGGRN